MKKIYTSLFVLFFAFSFNSCEEDEEIDKQKPEININFEGAFPSNCGDVLYFGESFSLKVLLTDNLELGTFSLDIHHNFDHHSHSTEFVECDMFPIKEAINPLTVIEEYSIPTGTRVYETNMEITIPSENETGRYEEGDYHFHISLTDKEGWSTQLGLGIKMAHR